MPKSYVLVTAMPPTRGHLSLIKFAAKLGTTAEVILCTQPEEPFAFERLEALREATKDLNVNLHHIHKTLPQEPDGEEGYWDMWLDFLRMFGMQPEDYIVASEKYGLELANRSSATFMPYDIDRDLDFTKATMVRRDPALYFEWILPEFQRHLRMTVTTFGAESVGKTTLAGDLAAHTKGYYIFEWARPYLETCGAKVTDYAMHNIWHGQAALQRQAAEVATEPFIYQDTDLYSTVGYWEHWNNSPVPSGLYQEAAVLKSDLYLLCTSNIPFEKDPLRYGGDKRETSDDYWETLLQDYGLTYGVIDGTFEYTRLNQARTMVQQFYSNRFASKIHYDRVS